MRVLVVGATGFVGRALVRALVEAGDEVRAGSRHPPASLPPRASWIHCDLARAETDRTRDRGMESAYYLVHSMGGQGASDFRAIDRACASAFTRAAATSACKRIVYLGGVAPRGRPGEHLASRSCVVRRS